MNLSDHSESIHLSIKQLKEGVEKLRIENPWHWFDDIFGQWGLSGWLKGLVKLGAMCILVFCCIIVCVPCMLHCMRRMMEKAVSAAWVAQKQEGGIVEEWLSERGHDLMPLSNPCYEQ